MDMNVALMASISAVSGGAGVVVAALALRRQKREELLDVIGAAIAQHQVNCPVADSLSADAERNRRETMAFLIAVKKDLQEGLKNVTARLDAIYSLVGKGMA